MIFVQFGGLTTELSLDLVSSYLGPEPADSVRRWDKKKKEHVIVPRPYVVRAYNNFMGGVDFLDSLISKYSYRMRSKRWCVFVLTHCINGVDSGLAALPSTLYCM